MNTSISNFTETDIYALHKQWAVWSARKFRFTYPEMTADLYEVGDRFALYVQGPQADSPDLSKIFSNQIKPMTCPIDLVTAAPKEGSIINEPNNYGAELWLNGEPLSTPIVNNILSLAVPDMPSGGLDYDNAHSRWVFKTFSLLSEKEQKSVASATQKIGISGKIHFEQVTRPAPDTPRYKPGVGHELDILPARQLGHFPRHVTQLVEQDEDRWRDFLEHRSKQDISYSQESEQPDGFACLFDTVDDSSIRLAELLTIYDRIDLIPDRHNPAWLEKHQLPLKDLQELVRLKRVRIIVPYSAHECPPDLLGAVSEVDPAALILSRSLASKTILHSQKKEPFLYAPLTAAQRASIISILYKVLPDQRSRDLLNSYTRLFEGQHYSFMMRGAMGNIGYGIGAHIGEVFRILSNKDARLELMTNGAAIEWALGLGASYIPRTFTGGFDETHNSHIIASILGRTPMVQADPATDRIHAVINGLLAVSDVPPIEIAKNFHSLSLVRFRKLAGQLMKGTSKTSELELAVEQLNTDVATFERRSEKLSRWKFGALAAGVVAAPIEDKVNLAVGMFASPIAAWVYDVFKEKLPVSIRQELEFAGSLITGLATASSVDTVIVSRARNDIKKP